MYCSFATRSSWPAVIRDCRDHTQEIHGIRRLPRSPAGGWKERARFCRLHDPFYTVDSRDYQVIQPDEGRIKQLGAHVLAIEKERPHVPLERAVMAIRFSSYMIGTQFHPEADATGMSMYLQREDKKKTVIAEHGEENGGA